MICTTCDQEVEIEYGESDLVSHGLKLIYKCECSGVVKQRSFNDILGDQKLDQWTTE